MLAGTSRRAAGAHVSMPIVRAHMSIAKYCCRPLADIYDALEEIMNKDAHTSDDVSRYNALKKIAGKAHAASVLFDRVVNVSFVSEYLNGELAITALCELALKILMESDSYSFSHEQWLRDLRLTKLKWDWESETPLQNSKRQSLMSDFGDLQHLAKRYPSLPIIVKTV